MQPSATILALVLAIAVACPLLEIEDRLAHADEHLFWAEFWTELDDGEAGRELAYAIDDLQRARGLADPSACGQDPVSRATLRIVHQRLSACLRSLRTAP